MLDGESQKYVSDYCRVPLPIEPAHAAALTAHEAQVKALDKQLAAAKKALEEFKAAAGSQRSLGITVDDEQAEKVGFWKPSTHVNRFIGKGYVHDDKQGKGEKSITFTPMLATAGEYEVRFAFAGSGGRDERVPVHVHHAEGEAIVHVNQVPEAPIEKLFIVLGRFQFEAGSAGRVIGLDRGDDRQRDRRCDAVYPSRRTECRVISERTGPGPRRRADEGSRARRGGEEGGRCCRPAAGPEGDCRPRSRRTAGLLGMHPRRTQPARPCGAARFLQVALYDTPPAFTADESGRRQLAEWIADPRNPLTARVFVNRVWAHLLGAGIVRSVDNFGKLGDAPTHPELLDRLASEFITHGWSLKRLVREIVVSRVYRQQAMHRDDAFLVDPENRLLWRAQRKRLPAEGTAGHPAAREQQARLESGGFTGRGDGDAGGR